MALYIGMGPRYSLSVIVPSSVDFDPLASLVATFEIVKPSGARVSWSTTVVTQTTALLKVTHAIQLADLDEAGEWLVWLRSSLSGGLFQRSVVGSFTVKATDQV